MFDSPLHLFLAAVAVIALGAFVGAKAKARR